jgi:hypothetical protein
MQRYAVSHERPIGFDRQMIDAGLAMSYGSTTTFCRTAACDRMAARV